MVRVTKKDYHHQTNLVRQTLRKGKALETLLTLMRNDKEASLYMCGSYAAHYYCLVSDDLGFLLSVLPEDSSKAATPGYHPGSAEIYVIINGSLVLQTLENGSLRNECLTQFDVKLISPGKCHRVCYEAGRVAASFIVKTNLKYHPDVVRCHECDYYTNPTECPLNRNWNEERAV